MFAQLTAAFATLAILAVANALPGGAPAPSAPAGGAQSCSTGAVQCCNSVQSADSAAIAPILGLLGVVLQDVNIPVGLSCSGITAVGVGSSNAW
ncbi:Fruiting body protein SC3 [Trametes pubescens]|uniref:Hydrophobin n=1 Tax=Trametes pubescens TaxID=154538 RepID=A0A1M2VWW6_TRAPU|nr:Fruiting body protein SC3 [Trametes pubescens]